MISRWLRRPARRRSALNKEAKQAADLFGWTATVAYDETIVYEDGFGDITHISYECDDVSDSTNCMP